MILKCPQCGTEVAEGANFCTNCGASLAEAAKETPAARALYCRNCGAKLPEGAAYCLDCGTPAAGPPPAPSLPRPRLRFAGWGERFVAWLIDIIIIGLFLSPIKWFVAWAVWPGVVWAPPFLRWIPFVDFGLDNVIYFLYWTVMEGGGGQSIGKMAMNLKVTQLDGKPTDMLHAAVESIGKAFLLPIDCIIGWILYPAKNQRLFNYISETVTVKTSR